MLRTIRSRRRNAEGQGDPTPELDPQQPSVPEPKPNSWFNTILQGLSYGLLGIALAAASIVVVIPKIAGAVPVTILSDSMAPSMPVGSLAIVKPNSPLSRDELTALSPEQIRGVSDYRSLQLGAVVAYQPNQDNPTIIIHRIISMSAHSNGGMTYTTKGDNNRVADRDKVADYQIRGTVWYHLPPPIGTFNTWLNHDAGHRSTAIISIAVIGYAWAMWMFGRAIWRYRKRRRAGGNAPAEGADEHTENAGTELAGERYPKRRELRTTERNAIRAARKTKA